jgi:hypothetical protein
MKYRDAAARKTLRAEPPLAFTDRKFIGSATALADVERPKWWPTGLRPILCVKRGSMPVKTRIASRPIETDKQITSHSNRNFQGDKTQPRPLL